MENCKSQVITRSSRRRRSLVLYIQIMPRRAAHLYQKSGQSCPRLSVCAYDESLANRFLGIAEYQPCVRVFPQKFLPFPFQRLTKNTKTPSAVYRYPQLRAFPIWIFHSHASRFPIIPPLVNHSQTRIIPPK